MLPTLRIRPRFRRLCGDPLEIQVLQDTRDPPARQDPLARQDPPVKRDPLARQVLLEKRDPPVRQDRLGKRVPREKPEAQDPRVWAERMVELRCVGSIRFRLPTTRNSVQTTHPLHPQLRLPLHIPVRAVVRVRDSLTRLRRLLRERFV